MRAAALFAMLAVVACGTSGAMVSPRAEAGDAAARSITLTKEATHAEKDAEAVAVDALADLEAQSRVAWPGTRVVHRATRAGAENTPVELGAEVDTCYRAFARAEGSARLVLAGRDRRELAVSTGTLAEVPTNGPLCVRRGESLALRIEGNGSVSVVVRASP